VQVLDRFQHRVLVHAAVSHDDFVSCAKEPASGRRADESGSPD